MGSFEGKNTLSIRKRAGRTADNSRIFKVGADNGNRKSRSFFTVETYIKPTKRDAEGVVPYDYQNKSRQADSINLLFGRISE